MRTMKRFALVPAGLLAVVLLAAACDEGLTGVNENPNAPTSVPSASLLPNAIGQSADLLWDSFWHMSLWSVFGQSVSQIQYPDEEKYDVRVSTLQGFWDGFYQGPLKDFDTVVQRAEEAGAPNVQAVGLIMRTYVFQAVTDAWGPVPYSEALQLEGGNSTPSYDATEAVYQGMLSDLERAVGMIDPSSVSPSLAGNDILYGGDMEKWRRFANSLRLKLALRLSNVDQGTASSVAQAAISGGVFQSTSDHARLDYAGGQNRNPIYVNGLTRDDHAPSEVMLSMMREWNDPRIPVYAQPAPNSEPSDPMSVRYVGGTIARPEPNALDDIARIGSFWREDPQAPVWFMSKAEVEFFKAEAAHRGLIGGSAQQYYEDGIRASMSQYGISGEAVDAYLAQPGVAWGSGSSGPMEKIGVQKWIALYMGGSSIEQYSEVRRLGYPAITPGPQALNVNQGHPPTRIPYPPLEQSLNNQSLQEAIQMLGGSDDYAAPLYWDPDGMVP